MILEIFNKSWKVIKYKENKTLTYIECIDEDVEEKLLNPDLEDIDENFIYIHPSIAHILKIENSVGNSEISQSDFVEIYDLYDEM